MYNIYKSFTLLQCVNQRLQIQLELLMMSSIPLETCWAFNERWNNKFCFRVASCWLFLLNHTTMHGSINIKSRDSISDCKGRYLTLLSTLLYSCLTGTWYHVRVPIKAGKDFIAFFYTDICSPIRMVQYDGLWWDMWRINNIKDPLLTWRLTTKYRFVLQIELASIKTGTIYINVKLRSIDVKLLP
jgi:hypothetical protein